MLQDYDGPGPLIILKNILSWICSRTIFENHTAPGAYSKHTPGAMYILNIVLEHVWLKKFFQIINGVLDHKSRPKSPKKWAELCHVNEINIFRMKKRVLKSISSAIAHCAFCISTAWHSALMSACIKCFYFESLVAKEFWWICCQAPGCLSSPTGNYSGFFYSCQFIKSFRPFHSFWEEAELSREINISFTEWHHYHIMTIQFQGHPSNIAVAYL